MTLFPRFFPAVFAAIVLLGCILPFGGTGNGPGTTLLGIPGAISQAVTAMSAMPAPFGQSQPTALQSRQVRAADQAQSDPHAATAIAWLVYLIPGLAIVILILNLRGPVMRSVQIGIGVAWLGLLFVPLLAARTLIASNPLLKTFAALGGSPSSLDFSVGGWLIALGALGMLLSGFGALKIIPVRAAQ